MFLKVLKVFGFDDSYPYHNCWLTWETSNKVFFGNHHYPKLNTKQCSTFETSVLQKVDMQLQRISSQKVNCSCIKKLYNQHFWESKIIPLYLINKYLAKNANFHPLTMLLQNFPIHYKHIYLLQYLLFKFLLSFTLHSVIFSIGLARTFQLKINLSKISLSWKKLEFC